MAAGAGAPLPSAAAPPEDPAELAEEAEVEEEIDAEETKSPPAPPAFKMSTFLYTFLFLLGILMLFETGTRYGVAQAVGYALGPLIGFGGHRPLLTMFCAAAFEMVLTALAYNYTTDWILAARVQKWSAALRKVQMAAMRSGKKDRIDSLKPYQQKLTRLSSEVSIAQLKGMAVTWFLLILIYTWVGLVIQTAYNANPLNANVNLGGSVVGLLNPVVGPIPYWFLIFSLYTVPLSFIFRRLLKDVWLARYERNHNVPPLPTPTS